MQVVGMLNVEGTMPHAAGGAQCGEGCGEDGDNQLDDSLPSGFINFHRHSNFGLSPDPSLVARGVDTLSVGLFVRMAVYTPLHTREGQGGGSAPFRVLALPPRFRCR